MFPASKSSSSSLILIATFVLVTISHVSCTPASFTDHFKLFTDKFLTINPNIKSPLVSGSAASPLLPSFQPSVTGASPNGHSVAKTLVSAISASSAKQHQVSHAVRGGRNVITKKRGVLSTFLSFPKGLRAALPLFGIRPLVQTAVGSRPAALIPAESMFQPSFLTHSNQGPGAPGQVEGVPLSKFLELQSAGSGPYAQRQKVIFPPFLGHIVSATGSAARPNGPSSDSLGFSESLISSSSLHHHPDHRPRLHHSPVRQQIQFIPLQQPHQQQHQSSPRHQQQVVSYHYNPIHGQEEQQQGEAGSPINSESEEAEKVMYVYVDEEGKTVATKVADMDMGPEAALPDGYNIKAVGAPLPVSQQDQQEAQQQQNQESNPQSHQIASEEAHDPESAPVQRPVLTGFANMHEISASAGEPSGPTTESSDPAAPLTAYLQSVNSPQMNPGSGAGEVSAPDDLGTEPPVGIGIPVHADDPRAGRIIFPSRDHKPKQVMTEETTIPIPDPVVDPEIPHSDPTQDMVFMLGDYNQYLKTHVGGRGESTGEDQNESSAADEFLHTLTSSPTTASEMEEHQQPNQGPQVQQPEAARVHSMRPPIRKQRILSTHGGWIPISRSPDHNSNNKQVAIAILTHKEPEKKQETGSQRQETSAHQDTRQQHQPQQASPEPEQKDEIAEGDVEKMESEPKVHFDDETTSNLQQDQATRVTFSTSTTISSSKELQRIKPGATDDKDERKGDSSNESEEGKRDKSNSDAKRDQQQVQKRSKYNIAAVFDHEFKPIFTSKSKSLDEIKDQELFSSASPSRGSYGLRIPRSSDFEAEDAEGSERIESSSLVPSTSSQASSASSASFSLRSGLVSDQLEETLKWPTGHFLVPVPGNDGKVKAYIVLSA